MSRKLTLGFSPCPNDTFIFDALVNHKIDTEGLAFEPLLEDVETLNQWALEERLDISKLSFPAFFQASDNYSLLNAGAALGKGVGPLLISPPSVWAGNNEPTRSSEGRQGITNDEVGEAVIAIPGIHTTANLLLSFAFPQAIKKIPMIFSAIEDAVLNGETDLGVIIHENRFTYQQKGLHKLMDLGEYWEQQTNMPVPLGGIAVKKEVDRLISLKVERLIKKSIEFAFANYPAITDYVRLHSQAIEENVMRQHIDLYVNNYSLDLGGEGKQAIFKLFEVYRSINKKSEPALSSRQFFLS